MKKYDGEMVRTKVEKFEDLKKFLEQVNCEDKELVDLCTNEINILTKKANSAKNKKDEDKEKEYTELENQVLGMFEAHPVLTNDDISLDISTSKKTTIMKRLIEKKLIVKNEKKKSKDKVSYSLAQ